MIRDAACDDILRRGQILHLGLFGPNSSNEYRGYPYIVPLTYGFDCKDDQIPVIYMHSGKKRPHKQSTIKLDAIEENPNVSFAVETDVQVRPVTENICKLSTVRYFSVLGTGKIKILHFKKYASGDEIDWKDPLPPIYGLQIILRQMTGKVEEWDFDTKIFEYLVILKLIITSYTAKDHAYANPKSLPFP